MKWFHYVSFATMLTVTAAAADNPSVAYIQRTMKTLENSTAENPSHVRVMFYGQSITAQAWTKTVQKQLEQRYPTVKFEFRNAAIGGYTSNVLIRTADHDLYPWYPDLLFFHVYGPMDKYEEIIKRVRERTSAEIVIWTSHLSSLSREKLHEVRTADDERAELIRAVAAKYNCILIDLRKKWRAYLQENGLNFRDFLTDGTHLNPKGCDLYAKLIGEELLRKPELGDNPTTSGTIKTVSAGNLTLRFTGNRVVAISDGTGTPGAKAKVLLDGKPMDGLKEFWAITRPSVGPAKIWMPAINNIGFNKPLLEEDWTLTCLPDSTPDGKKIHFKLRGSVTGDDGEGWNTERFVSRSQRAIIEPGDWRIAWTLEYKKATLPEGFKVTWRSYPLFTRIYEPKPAGTRTLLVQNCSNQPRTLTLIPEGGSLGISAFVVHAPPKGKP
ncbi:MAG: SGNH/GDSL hydrolase family protein [Verrucomicrobia bacterium]|nr:SGNH/GDSL hydrolase family protein [Verrucomicrobiota bacterium]